MSDEWIAEVIVSKPSNRSKAFRVAAETFAYEVTEGVSKPSNRSKAFRVGEVRTLDGFAPEFQNLLTGLRHSGLADLKIVKMMICFKTF